MTAMLQTVESRAVLSSIINSGLYPGFAREPIEDIIEEMKKKDIDIRQQVNLATSSERGAPLPPTPFLFPTRIVIWPRKWWGRS